jgi:hypothetical protein
MAREQRCFRQKRAGISEREHARGKDDELSVFGSSQFLAWRTQQQVFNIDSAALRDHLDERERFKVGEGPTCSDALAALSRERPRRGHDVTVGDRRGVLA